MTRGVRRFALLLALWSLLSLVPVHPVRAATFTVTTTADSGAGSLRQAILDANAQAGPHTIQFAITGCPDGVCTITPLSPLPDISGDPTTIDATTQSGWTTTNRTVVLDGTSATGSNGLTITSDGHTIKGFVITNFQRGALDPNGGSGILLRGSDATDNRIIGNYIGVARDGTTAAGNDLYGIWLYDGASDNQIGGTAAGEGNLVSGNLKAEIYLGNAQVSGTVRNNTVAGNLIGTDATGEALLSFARTETAGGVAINSYTEANIIGPRNTVGGYTGNTAVGGITLFSNTASEADFLPKANRIIGNYIGVSAGGLALPNAAGVRFPSAGYGAVDTIIGGSSADERNYIAGNDGAGIELFDSSFPVENLTIIGNWIGFKPNTSGTSEGDLLPNAFEGIYIGRTTTAPKVAVSILNNVISGNRLSGIDLRSDNNIVRGNYIGTSADGETSSASASGDPPVIGFANLGAGIVITNGSNNTIGGGSAGQGNVIAYGGASGQITAVWLEPADGATSANNTVVGNYIGLDKDGVNPLNIDLNDSSVGVQVDGATDSQILNNIIGGNGYGIYVQAVRGTPTNTLIEGNAIGTDAARTNAVSNRRHGIYVTGGSDTQITNNLIANNGTASVGSSSLYHGIKVEGSTTLGTVIRDNQIVSNGKGAFGTGGSGVYVTGATGVTISRSETTDNRRFGIELVNGNNSLAAPTISGASVGADLIPRVSGTACANCTVEIFTSLAQEDDEGPIYVSSGAADGSGAFTIPIIGCSNFLAATATDSAGNTSQFTSPMFFTPEGVCSPPNFTLSEAIPSATQSAIPGAQAVFTHTLTNLDAITRTVTLTRLSTQGWAAQPVPETIDLAGNASIPVIITVSVPLNAVVGDQDVTTLTATSGTVEQVQTDTTIVAAPSGAQPAISSSQLRILPPGTTTITFTHLVTNTGGVSGTFTLSASPLLPLPAGWTIVSATLGQSILEAAEATQATLVISVPVNAPAAQAIIRLQVTETGSGSAAAADDTLIVPFTAGFAFGESAESPIAAVAPGQVVTFTHQLTNTGNGTDTFSVTVDLPTSPGVWSLATPLNTPISLDSGEVTTVTLRVQVPLGVSGGPITFDVGAQSMSLFPPDYSPITRTNVISEIIAGATPLLSEAPAQQVNVVGTSRTLTFTHVLTNVGNGPSTFLITPTLPISATGWTTPTVVNSTCAITVAASGGTCGFAVVVTVPADEDAGDYPITIQATATDRSAASTAVQDRVIVETVASLLFIPNRTLTRDPGTVITYSHTLTNTGNATDSFTITQQLGGPSAWQVRVSPTQLSNVPRGARRTVQVIVTVPRGLEAIPTNSSVVTVTARSANDPTVTAQVVDTTNIKATFGAAISSAPAQNAQVTATVSATITFTHMVTNTGSTTISYTLAISNSQASWDAPVVRPTQLIALAPGASAPITITIVVPAGTAQGTINTTSVRVYNASDTQQNSVLASTNDVVTVGPQFGILFTPSLPTRNEGTIQPGQTRSYTHTLTNRGSQNDSYILTSISGLGWETLVSPDRVELAPDESIEIVVSVSAPTSVLSGTVDVTEVQVQSITQPLISAKGQERSTVAQQAALSITPRQFRTLDGKAQTVSIIHYLTNTGNGLETFVITTSNDLDWNVVIATPITITLGVGIAYPVQIRINVPGDLDPGTLNTVRVNATPQSNPTARQSVTTTLNYPQVVVPKRVYIPMVVR